MTNIIMLVHGRYKLTEQSLSSLFNHTCMEDFTLTLVHDCPDTDFRVGHLLDKYISHPNTSLIRLVNSEHVLAKAKNVGVYWSELTFGRGDWLYLSDNDVYFTPGWLGKLTDIAARSEHAGYGLWGGQVHPFHAPNDPDPHPEFPVLYDYDMLDGPSWLMRWGLWEEKGGLRISAPGVCQGEDVEFCNRIGADAWGIGVIHPFVVYHTGLTNSDGKDAPGRAEREAGMIQGVIYE